MERYVECESRGLTLRGMLHVPDQRPGKVPFVILFHGFCDDRNEINFVHTELSRRLCERGIASVRFDFAGSGDSDGRFEDMTVSSEVEDGLAILDYVKSLDFVDQSRIAIHGLSMGGCVASMVAGLRDADVCALSLWCPAPDVVYNMKHKMLCGVDVSDIEEKGYADYEGLRVGLGSVVAGGAHLSLFRAMTDAIQCSKLRWRLVDETIPPLTLPEALYLATKGGGAFFGKVGSFEPGYEFDAVVLDDSTLPTPRELTLAQRLERVAYLSDGLPCAKYAAGRRLF